MNMIIGMFTSRMLGPDGIGHFQVFSSTQTIIVTILSMGLGQASIYYINSKGYSTEIVVTMLIKFFIPMSIFSSVCTILLIFLNQQYFGVITTTSLCLFSIGTSALLFITSLKAILLAGLNIKNNQIVQYSASIVIFSIVILFYFLHKKLNVASLLIIYSIGNLLSATILYGYFHKYISWNIIFKFKIFKPLCKLGITMSASNLSQVFFMNSPIYAFTWFYLKGFEQVGLYSRALSIMTIATFTIQAIGPLLYAKLSSVSDKEKIWQTQISSTAFFLFNTLLFCVIQILAKPLIYILYGNDFLGAVPYLRILSLSLFCNGVLVVSLNLLSSKGEARSVLKSIIIGTVVLWISVCASMYFNNPLSIAYCVVLSNVVTAFFLVSQTTKIMDISIIDFLPVKFSQIEELAKILKSGIK